MPLLQLMPPQPRPMIRNQVHILDFLNPYIAKEEKKEEEADVDMGGLFGDDY